MEKQLGVGLIGCGSISTSYLDLAPQFKGFDIIACADLNMDTATALAANYDGLEARTVEALLASDDIDIIVNLTIPAAHYQVSTQILQAGKHVYSEKPFVLSLEEGLKLQALAKEKGLRVGSTPDTFLGGSHQQARALIDQEAIGDVLSGTCHVMSRGMEHWHPNPDFFFKIGGGPVLDIGPYYITNLIQLLGPVASVIAKSTTPRKKRLITSSPRNGDFIDVETPTTIHAVLEFENGALITLGTSWDVQAHQHSPIELYGSKGSLYIPDPNFFGGQLTMTSGPDKVALPEWQHPFAIPNQIHGDKALANYRTAGLADMIQAIQSNRPHRCSQELALHGVEVMLAILQAGETGQAVPITTQCEQPAALDGTLAQTLLRD
ncbi:Gfo/Idh/MocA family oxidoreductase [Marinomonas agarivorans]|nr:Gfo/Idh/MocA family oxidoreductase [Marinomonas agarivorans]